MMTKRTKIESVEKQNILFAWAIGCFCFACALLIYGVSTEGGLRWLAGAFALLMFIICILAAKSAFGGRRNDGEQDITH